MTAQLIPIFPPCSLGLRVWRGLPIAFAFAAFNRDRRRGLDLTGVVLRLTLRETMASPVVMQLVTGVGITPADQAAHPGRFVVAFSEAQAALLVADRYVFDLWADDALWITPSPIAVFVATPSPEPERYSLDVATLGGNCDTVIETIETGVAGVTFEMFGTAGFGLGQVSIQVDGLAVLAIYEDGVSTVAALDDAIDNSQWTPLPGGKILRVKTPGTGANVLAAPADNVGPAELVPE